MRIPSRHLLPTCALVALAAPFALHGQISITLTVGPPPLPYYEQPRCPEVGYAWAPGYWAWGEDGYYWVPGTWVLVPEPGLLWTPGYWGWNEGSFMFHRGYWGLEVGFYGGINYGYGYGGSGFDGGYWRGRDYYYNRAVANVNITQVTHVYTRTVVVRNVTAVAYNGGNGGIAAAPSPRERTAERENRVPPTRDQERHHERASQDRVLLASVNRGRPAVAATARPADFTPGNIVAARAPGGRVPEATLKATARTMPPPIRNAPAVEPERRREAPSTAPRNAPRQEVSPGRPSPERRPDASPRPAPAPIQAPEARRPAPPMRPAPPVRNEPLRRAPERENDPVDRPMPMRPRPPVARPTPEPRREAPPSRPETPARREPPPSETRPQRKSPEEPGNQPRRPASPRDKDKKEREGA